MAKREIKNLALKIKYTNEYLKNGGMEKVLDPGLLQDLINAKFDVNGNPEPDSITARLNAFMMVLLATHTSPPFYDPEHISEYNSTLQKDLFFEQLNVDTKEELEEMYQDFNGQKNMLFRGQREAKWRLYNKAQRQWILDGIFNYDISYRGLLEQLVVRGRDKHIEQIQATLKQFHIDTANDISILAFLQHHGCPTPLMDWTFNFQTGLFFAVDGATYTGEGREIDQYVSLYYLEKEHFEGGSMRSLLSGGLATVSEGILDGLINIIENPTEREAMRIRLSDRSFFDRAKLTGSGFVKDMVPIQRMMGIPQAYFSDDDQASGLVFSLANSQNIIRQQGAFIWNASPSVPFEMIAAEEYEKDKKADDPADFRFCKCLNIHKSLVPQLLEKLAADGITSASIYPTTAKETDTWEIYKEVKGKLKA